jgi:hypothetical protein
MSARELAKRVVALQGDAPLQERQAVVTAVHPGPPATVDVTLGGDPIPGCRYLAWYTPTIGDVVRVLQEGGDLLVLGDLA